MELKRKALSGVIWSGVQTFSTQGFTFIIGVILARLLTPSDYGLIGMLTIFLAISSTFVNSGFTQALIQKKDSDEKDFSTSFYFNLGVGFIFYLLLFIAAPLIAGFYNQEKLIPLTRVLGLVVLINSFSVVQRAMLTIKIDFRTQSRATILAVIISGLLGIYLAYTGYGVWALVAQSILKAFFEAIFLWYYAQWIPLERFHFERFKGLFNFGSKLLISGLLNTVFNNLYSIIIGKSFSVADLGFYTRATQLNNLPSINVTNVIRNVAFPILSKVQNDNLKLKETFKIVLKSVAFIVFPIMCGIGVLASPLVSVLLTEKWLDVVWMLQFLVIVGVLYPISALNLMILNVKGRSDLFLKLGMIKKIVETMVLIFTVPMGIKEMIIGQVGVSVFSAVVNTFYTKKVVDFGLFNQIKALRGILALSFFMVIVIYYFVGYLNGQLSKLFYGGILGFIIYMGTGFLLNVGNIRGMLTELRKI